MDKPLMNLLPLINIKLIITNAMVDGRKAMLKATSPAKVNL